MLYKEMVIDEYLHITIEIFFYANHKITTTNIF